MCEHDEIIVLMDIKPRPRKCCTGPLPCRVLQHGGTFLLISLGEPAYRLQYLNKEKYNWTITVYLLPRVPQEEFVVIEGR